MWLSWTAVAALAAVALGQPVQPNSEESNRLLAVRQKSPSLKIPITNNKERGGYFMNVNVGTPSQQVSLQLDTGSSDLWVPSVNADICNDVNSEGCTLGTFDPSMSNTFDSAGNSPFVIAYQDQSSTSGEYFKDQIALGDITLRNFTMGLGIKSTIAYGLAGVGYSSDEAAVQTSESTYSNLPLALQQAGYINTPAYSLWLNDLSASTGSILFGAIDTEEYVGDLTKIPILSDPRTNQRAAFTVSMHSLEASSPSGSDVLTSGQPLSVILDSGTSFTYLPPEVAARTWQEVGAIYDATSSLPLLPCSFANHEGSFSFVFAGADGPRVNVTMRELVVPIATDPVPKLATGPFRGRDACSFGILNQTESPFLLGDTFLRSAYVVYDLANNEIGIAPTHFNSSKSNVVAFPSNGAPIPSATAASTQTSNNPSAQPTDSKLKAAGGFQSGASTMSKDSFLDYRLFATYLAVVHILVLS
ncbi:hypothetical protein HIM_03300 [Hirsutella minnesotensis 3608]|nr:hypothetical protein HIM_03300 [Hirsutella minnesotensis 3608]